MSRHRSRLLGLALAAAIGGCGVGSPAPAPAPARAADVAPKLVVVLLVDGFSPSQLLQARERLGEGGFARLMKDGACYTNAQYGYSTTVTGAGHATLLSGAYPYRHGIVGNDWIDHATKKPVYCTEDPDAGYLGEKAKPGAGTSPKLLKVTTIGDELRMETGGRSKVFAISMKDRGAILPGGKLGMAYFYSTTSGRFITSDYYLKEYPEWWKRFHDGNPQNKWFGTEWKPLKDDAAWGVPDERAFVYNVKELGKKFPHKIDGGKSEPGPEYYAALPWTPFGHDYLLGFGKAAIREERLGKNPEGVPDLLSVSLSSHDYVNHAYGPESREAADGVLRLDAALADFFKFLDDWVGRDGALVILTADHGFSRSPEYWKDRLHFETGRISHEDLIQKLNAHLAEKFGEGVAAIGWQLPTVFLDYEAIDKKKIAREEVEKAAARFLSAYPGVQAVFTRTQLLAGEMPATRLGVQVQRAWHPDVSGDIVVIQKDGWFLPDKETKYASMHGSPWTYDTHVPLMFSGNSWIVPGKYGQEAQPLDIAPTLAHLLNVGLPSGCEGRVLMEILKR